MGKSDTKGWMVGGMVMLNDLWDTGTNIALTGSKVGSEFITNGFEAEEFDFAGLDNFDRPLEAATVTLGGALTQTINDRLALVGKGDLRMSPDFGYGEDKAKSRLTGQIGVTYGVAKDTTFDAFYRVEQDPTQNDTTDLGAVGLVYNF
jgi:hypothetical protein